MIAQIEENSKTIQRVLILQYLEEYGSATVRDLVVKLNINSPTKRISELVKLGYPIEKIWVKRTNSKGQTKRYMRYRLKKGNKDVGQI